MPWLARLSLYFALVTIFARPSCLVTSVPEFPEPRPQGPLLRVIYPDPSQIIRLNKGTGTASSYPKILVTVQVFSEGSDDTPLQAYFSLDDEKVKFVDDIQAVHLNCNSSDLGGGRQVAYDYELGAGTSNGCHALSLHIKRTAKKEEGIVDAKATWWLDVDDPFDTAPMAGCPGANIPYSPPDAGPGGR